MAQPPPDAALLGLARLFFLLINAVAHGAG
jgi:hypothetical protein